MSKRVVIWIERNNIMLYIGLQSGRRRRLVLRLLQAWTLHGK